jgi:hypothetical protein
LILLNIFTSTSSIMQNKFLVHIFLVFAIFASLHSLSQNETKTFELNRISKLYDAKQKTDIANLLQLAKQKGWALTLKSNNPNQVIILTGVDINGIPVYTTSNNNIIAAATTHTNQLWQGGFTGFNLSGSSANMNGKIAIWDGGCPMTNHIEFGNRIINKDGSSILNHTTHVAGTLIATGINPVAKGMAYGAAKLNAYDFNNHISEMFGAANNLLVSNHSYGAVAGWNYAFSGDWDFWGNWGDSADYKFGIYNDETLMFDSVAYNAPFYLIVKSVGNNRDKNGPPVGTPYRRYDINGNMIDAGVRPVGLSFNNSYDIIPTYGVAKNILTVGAVEGIASGSTKSSDIKMSSFSSWGPTDDGRIKPDLVADGVDVLSCSNSSSTGYETMSGTSMATPNVTGSLYLLQELYSQKNSGAFMKASTLKALAIHTASEAGINDGPDYQFGWGLLNAEEAANIINGGNTGTNSIIESTLNNGATYSLNVVASGNGKLMATLAWTDPVGTVTTTNLLNNPSLKLIHDLDIRILKGSTIYMPWILDPANPSAVATKGDNFRDNVERVEIDDLIPGETYTIQITHKGILQRGSQVFSLILSSIGGISYCTPHTINNGDIRIDNFSFANINNTSTTCDNYTINTNLTAKLEPAKTYPLNLSLSSCNTTSNNKNIKVYIDYNYNGSFAEANELVYSGNVTNGSINANVTVPSNVVIGNYSLMRVVVAETSAAFDACSPANQIGAIQDYRVQFINPAIDVSITEIAIPVYNNCSSNNQYISVRITNAGDSNISNIPLTVVIKNGATTIATITENFKDTLKSGASFVHTFQTPINSIATNTYNITATASLATDQNPTNNSKSTYIVIANAPTTASGQASICGNTATLRAFNTNNNQNYYWYNAANATSPIAAGTNTTTSTIAPNYYIGSGVSTNIGAISKAVFIDGDYQAKGGNYFKYSSTVPFLLENAKIYTAYPGKVTLIAADIKATLADGSYTYNTLNSTTIDVSASRPTKMRGDIAGNDMSDLGLVYNINLFLPSGNHALIIKTDSVANIFRNKNVATNPYPYSIPNLFTITGNNATNPSQFYYYLYNMSMRTLDCTSDRIAVVPTTAAAPTITQVADSLVCSAGINYQWRKDNVDINGEINQTYKPTGSGNYSCIVTDNSGCQQTSNIISFINLNDITERDLKVYPNPCNSFINIDFATKEIADMQIRISDILGRIYSSQTFTSITGNINKKLNTFGLADGVYVMTVLHGNKTFRTKFVVER